jgi:hypothetical protein
MSNKPFDILNTSVDEIKEQLQEQLTSMKLVSVVINPIGNEFIIYVLCKTPTGHKVFKNKYKTISQENINHCLDYGLTVDEATAKKIFVNLPKDIEL